MKKLFLTTIVLFITVALFAQSEKYTTAIKKNLEALDSGMRNPASLLTVANNFERIATAEKTQWLPYYYAALAQINYAFMQQDKDKMDGIADKATALINSADSLSPKNSEISCLKSMVASCHLMVNPQQRWQEYGAESTSNIQAAMQQDTTNPRPYFLTGQGLKYTPEQFGGGCKPAKAQLQIALDKYATFKPASDINPAWGKEYTQKLMADCQ